MSKKNNKLYKLVLLITILVLLNNKSSPQIMAPSCFTKEECKVPLKIGYCDVVYDCVVGKCKHAYIPCQETCYGKKDEDMDNLIDCDDPDCFDSIECPCERASFNECTNRHCSCPSDKVPKWYVYADGSNECRCI